MTTREEWNGVDTTPGGKIVLFWAITAYDDNGNVSNWRMATGSIPYDKTFEEASKSSGDDRTWITWDGRYLKTYDILPTHWQHLPSPPEAAKP